MTEAPKGTRCSEGESSRKGGIPGDPLHTHLPEDPGRRLGQTSREHLDSVPGALGTLWMGVGCEKKKKNSVEIHTPKLSASLPFAQTP